MIEFKAYFDGVNICPDEPVSLPAGVPLRVTVTPAEQPRRSKKRDPFAEVEAKCGLIEDGPPDWAAEHDHYLYGAPKWSDAISS